MKIGPNFEITSDRYNVILTEWVEGKDRDGNPKRQPRETYHPSLEKACLRVLARLSDESLHGTPSEVIACIRRAEAAIVEAVKGRAA